MNKRHYEHTLPNIRGSLSNTYVVQPLERSFQLGYVPEKLPFLLGVPFPWATSKGQTPAILRCAHATSGCLLRKCQLFIPGTAECNLFVPSYFHVTKVILKSF